MVAPLSSPVFMQMDYISLMCFFHLKISGLSVVIQDFCVVLILILFVLVQSTLNGPKLNIQQSAFYLSIYSFISYVYIYICIYIFCLFIYGCIFLQFYVYICAFFFQLFRDFVNLYLMFLYSFKLCYSFFSYCNGYVLQANCLTEFDHEVEVYNGWTELFVSLLRFLGFFVSFFFSFLVFVYFSWFIFFVLLTLFTTRLMSSPKYGVYWI